jgi:4-amino-4-deoxy-L-arabinose transferase-like glycosyltransferase
MRGAAFGGALLGLTLLGGALRFGMMDASFPARPTGDELYYVGTAVNIAEGHGHLFNRNQRAFRPPAWSYLLAPFVDVELRRARLDADTFLPALAELDPASADPDLLAFVRPLLSLPLLFGTLLVPLTALLGRVLFDARTGLAAGAASAVLPSLVAFSHSLMSETFFAVCATAGLTLAVLGQQRKSALLAVAAGLLFGVATLTREIGAGVAGLCAVWGVAVGLPGERRAAALRGALLVACCALVVAPWTWRNHQLFGRLLPVSSVGWFAAGEGNTLEHPDWLEAFGPRRLAFKKSFFTTDGEMARVDYARQYTLEQIAAEQPLWLPRKLARNLGLLWTPDTVWLARLRAGAYGDVSDLTRRGLLVLHVVLYALLLGGAALGMARAGSGRASLAVGVLGLVMALHVLANATPRFRVPWLPLLCVYAAYATVHARQVLAPPRRRALLAPLVVLAFVAWASGPYFAEEAREVWASPLESRAGP